MMDNVKITERQFIVLVILYIIGSAILVIPSILVSLAKQDAWITAILPVGVALSIMSIYVLLGRRFPNMTLIEYTEEILGVWLGKTVSLLFLTFPVVAASLTLYNIGDFMKTQIMPETPIEAIYILAFGITLMGVRLGLEVLARSGEILFPLVIFLFLLLVVFITPELKFENLQPVFEEGIKPVLIAGIHFLSFPFLDTVIFLMIFPYVNWTQKAGKSLYKAILLGGIFLSVIIFLSILVLGVDQAARQIYSTYFLAKKINVGDFVTRIEAIVAGIWFISTFFKMSMLFYVLNLGIAQILNLKDYRFLTLPLGMILLVFSLVSVPNTAYLGEYILKTGYIFTATFGLLLPLLLLAVDTLRKKTFGS
ncbi:spore gernimation protein [Peribacillus butanolivorans]|uniref:Spore gernimation protein n=2 Tax=Peribacillus butanolivorans TaxID=421767 RepID=A0ABM6XQ39_9BACI|nr:spore gernimation protein [Peribacillus butanolivorans]